MDVSLENLIASSSLAWITLNNLVTENQKPIEFGDHRFMIDPISDPCDDIVGKKSAQVGWSVMEIMRSFHAAKHEKRNIGYILPTRNVVDDFVKPKVNPLIASNPLVAEMVSDDSISLKKVGDRFIYFKGAFSQTGAISFSIDTLVLDEYDRMPSMAVVNTFDSRLQAATDPKRRRFSNPSQIGYGVDGLYQDSNQYHWMVKCTHCNNEWYMEWTPDGPAHYVDRELGLYVCGKCKKEITDEARRMGRWVAKYPSRPRHGYWFSQMMAPWVSAKRVIEQYEESNIEFFHNFVLGKAYTPTDMIVDRMAILRATAPSTITKTQVAIGVDQDAGGQYYVCMTPQGIFDHGYVDSWEKIEHLKLMYNAIVVCDPNPYQAMPKQMANKYSDWYLCYFKNLDGLSAIQWKENEQIVYADRTRIIDIRANEIVHARMLYREHVHQLEDIIAHWNNLYRTTEEKEDGRVRSIWVKKDDKQSDYPFSECLDYETLVITSQGKRPIGEIQVGDKVLTRKGYRRVKESGLTGIKPVYRATFTNGSVITGTANHPIYTHNRGFIPLCEINADDIMEVCKSEKSTQSSTVVSTPASPIQRSVHTGFTTQPLPFLKPYYTETSGHFTTELFRKAMRSITKIRTPLTMTPQISYAYQGVNTDESTASSDLLTPTIKPTPSKECTALKQLPNQRHGSTAKQAKRFSITPNSTHTLENSITSSVVGVAKNTMPPTTELTKDVQKPVRLLSTVATKGINTWLIGSALSVMRHLKPTNGNQDKPAQDDVRLKKLIKLREPRKVYNLTVEDQPEYYANGILVHNCYARIGLSQLLGGESTFLEPSYADEPKKTNISANGDTLKVDFSEIIEEAYNEMDT